MKDYDLKLHVQGLSQFIDDIAIPDDALFAAIFASPVSHGEITKMDFSRALLIDGIVDIITWKDIPGKNQIGHIIADEPLFVNEIVEYAGQPIALVVGKTKQTAKDACKLITLEYNELPSVFDPRESYKKGKTIGQERIFSTGNIEAAWSECDYVFSNSVNSGAQEHLYMETQSVVSIPLESNRFKILSSTQSPSAVQKTVAGVLGIRLNQIEVDVMRIGGGFGGKEDQANAWAAMAAVATYKLKKTIKLILPRQQDIIITGKRHPYTSDFKIGLTSDLKIIAYEVTFYQNAGAFADLSTAILERSLFHATNCYYIPNVCAKGVSCKTNLPPNTAFRGFGGPQAMFVMESAIYEAARQLKVPTTEIQKRNLFRKDDIFHYGMKFKNNAAVECWETLEKKYSLEQKVEQITEFNNLHSMQKKGLSVMPICFGISFTSTFLNQASALVNIFNDGSLSISTGAIEMGQGVNEKIRKIASGVFSVSEDRIRIESTNTTRIANISPTAASTGADLNGNATRIACEEILKRLKTNIPKILQTSELDSYEIRDEIIYHNNNKTHLSWENLILKTYSERISLSSQAFYATPDIYFDRIKEKGNPFAYHVNGCALIEILIDCLRGTLELESVELIHDAGNSFAPLIDIGQLEGGVVQGLGWMTMEEIQHSVVGKLTTNSLSTYKIPDIFSVPKQLKIDFLRSDKNLDGVMGAKAIGEPPFMYGIGVYFAMLNAIKSFNPTANICYSAPFTNEKILKMLYNIDI